MNVQSKSREINESKTISSPGRRFSADIANSPLTIRSMTNFNWYVVYTKPKCELKVANFLARKNIKTYCPLHLADHRSGDSKKLSPEPLFTSFVFVYIQESEMPAVQATHGILNFLYWLNKPVTVSEDDINSLVKLSKEYDNLKLEKCILQYKKSTGAEEPKYEVINPEPVADDNIKVALPSLGYYVIAKSTVT